MKHIIYIAIFFTSALSYAQDIGTISGNLFDFESYKDPLIFAKVTIKESGAKILTDEQGFFKFENLIDGEYTLVGSFVGYETKELKIKVTSNVTNIKLVLKPSTISIEDLVLTMASVDNSTQSMTNN